MFGETNRNILNCKSPFKRFILYQYLDKIMGQPKTFENYPGITILTSNLVSIAIYLMGTYIIYQLGIIWLLFYLIYIFGLEILLMKRSCVNCYYYGKFCAFGKGKISSLFFKKGNSHKFIKRVNALKDRVPWIRFSLTMRRKITLW